MRRQLTIILTILTLGSCQHSKTERELTKLEKFKIESDSLTSNSKTYDYIVNFIQTKKPKFRSNKVTITDESVSGLSREIEFSSDYDTTGKLKDRVLFLLKITEFTSNRLAACAFEKMVEFHACCIPDEDIIKLKNFENLEHFKNNASTIILSENIMIEFIPANQVFINEEISELIEEILREKKYLKLEIGHGGPAIWTRKYENNAL